MALYEIFVTKYVDRIAKDLRRTEPLALTVLDFRYLERHLSDLYQYMI